jgi:DNA polymerase-3 subunit beta
MDDDDEFIPLIIAVDCIPVSAFRPCYLCPTMRIKVNRDHLAAGIAHIMSVIGAKAVTPILSNVLLVASKNGLSLTATNLDISTTCRIVAEVQEEGSITLPGKRLASIVRELPAIDVEVQTQVAGTVRIVSGGSRFKISGIEAGEFPAFPWTQVSKTFSCKQADFQGMLKRVAFAQSQEQSRYVLQAVFFLVKSDQLVLAATDGRRLAKISSALEDGPQKSMGVIIPSKAISELIGISGIGESVDVTFDNGKAFFQFQVAENKNGLVEGVDFVTKLVDGNYPNYDQVIPRKIQQIAKVGRNEFLDCVHRVSLVCDDKNNVVKFKFADNAVVVSAESQTVGTANETLPINYSGAELEIAFNPGFILDVLRVLTEDELTLEFQDTESPVVIKAGASFINVTMPVRRS